MLSATITIGRNVVNVPMSENSWINFKLDIESIFSEIFVNAEYSGEWEGVKEQSNIFVGILKHNDIELLERQLSRIAKQYSQDAIGLIVNSRQDSLVYKAA